eukprot:GAHX01001222.1.p1 GENE.GAHX01001222.1~~GAHX01001222.1.p1  ORF type:complete len:504 (+),score=53.40 GAHX01001222.1:71-1582(+)
MWISSYLSLTFGCPTIGVMLFTACRILYLKKSKEFARTSQILTLYYLLTITIVPIIFVVYGFGYYCPRLAINLYIIGRTSIISILLLAYSRGFCKCWYKDSTHKPPSTALILFLTSIFLVLIIPHVIISCLIKTEIKDYEAAGICNHETTIHSSNTVSVTNSYTNSNGCTSNLKHEKTLIGLYTHIINIIFSMIEGCSLITLFVSMARDCRSKPIRRSLSETGTIKKYLKTKKIKSQTRSQFLKKYYFMLLYTVNIIVFQVIHVQHFHIFLQTSLSRAIINIILSITALAANLGVILTCYKFENKMKTYTVNLQSDDVVSTAEKEIKNLEIVYLKQLFDLLMKVKEYISGLKNSENMVSEIAFAEHNFDHLKRSFIQETPMSNENSPNKQTYIHRSLSDVANLISGRVADIEIVQDDIVNQYEGNYTLVNLNENVANVTANYRRKVYSFSRRCKKYKNKHIKNEAFKEVLLEYYKLQREFLERIEKTVRKTLEEDIYLKSLFI